MKKKKHKNHKQHAVEINIFKSPIFMVGTMFVFLLSFYFSYNAFATEYFSLSSSIAREEMRNEKVLEKLSKLMLIPNEQPAVAIIDDVNFLKKDLDFYKNAQEGDYVFLFPNMGQVIVYRYEEDKIINYGPLVDGKN